MPLTFPIDFEELAALPAGPTNADYPYSIKAADLMRDYTYAALDAEEALIEEDSTSGGYTFRKLKIAAGSQPGTLLRWDGENGWVEYLGESPGELLAWDGEQWVTTPAPEQAGQLLAWGDGQEWQLVAAPSQPNEMLYWNGNAWQILQAPPQGDGTYVLGSENGTLTWLATEDCD